MTIETVITLRVIYIYTYIYIYIYIYICYPKLFYLFPISAVCIKFVDFLPGTYPCTCKKLMTITRAGSVNTFLTKSIFTQ
jgi:hypothetical protein